MLDAASSARTNTPLLEQAVASWTPGPHYYDDLLAEDWRVLLLVAQLAEPIRSRFGCAGIIKIHGSKLIEAGTTQGLGQVVSHTCS